MYEFLYIEFSNVSTIRTPLCSYPFALAPEIFNVLDSDTCCIFQVCKLQEFIPKFSLDSKFHYAVPICCFWRLLPHNQVVGLMARQGTRSPTRPLVPWTITPLPRVLTFETVEQSLKLLFPIFAWRSVCSKARVREKKRQETVGCHLSLNMFMQSLAEH
jgi:hypothetical protein